MDMIVDFAKHADASHLPVVDVLSSVRAVLDHGQNLVLIAPPGAGKTSLVPLALHDAPWRVGKKILLVEPRRIAARSAAQRMAQLSDTAVGHVIGYSTRLERVVSRHTEIEVVTEGLFLRRLLTDPFLEQTCAVIFDEAHERNLELDTGLALALSTQRALRPDLRLAVMSATVAGETFAQLMGAETVVTEGRAHPLTIHHAAREIHALSDIPARAAAQARHALDAVPTGNILVFLPGMREIRQAEAHLKDAAADVLTLHGDLPIATQDRVFKNAAVRKIILATSIAETSVTIPGTKVVIDSGFRRTPRYDHGTGLSRLETVRVSRAAAAQRAGRAGRDGPGVAYRLWSEAAHRGLAPYDAPEIASTDLSALVLQLELWRDLTGLKDLSEFFLNPPPEGAVKAAFEILNALGACDTGGLTAFGRKMLRFGTHPRLSAILCSAQSEQERATACILCALLEEKDPFAENTRHSASRDQLGSADITPRVEAIKHAQRHNGDRSLINRIEISASRYRAMLSLEPGCTSDPSCIGALLASGFPDRIAKAIDHQGQFRMASGGRVQLAPSDPLAKHRFIVAARIRKARATIVELAGPVTLETLPPSIIDTIVLRHETALDPITGKVISREKRSLGGLTLSERDVSISEEDLTAILLSEVKNDITGVLKWSDACMQFQARVALGRRFQPDLPDLSTAHLADNVENWLVGWLTSCRSRAQLASIDLLPILKTFLTWSQRAWLDENLPETATMPRGSVKINYDAATPTVSARAQAFYGCGKSPCILNGALPLQLVLLSPAGRPQAITSDLTTFWRAGWQDMRRDMRGRYPKHEWPEDPATASAPKPRPRP